MTGEPTSAAIVVDDGTEIVYHRWEPAAGRDAHPVPVVLQHGFAADTTVDWVRPGTVAALVAGGRRVVGVDARGHGRSQKSADETRYGERRMARDLRAVIATLGVPAVDLAGDADPLAVRPRVLADAISGAHLNLVAGAHDIVTGNADFRDAIVDFLR